MYKYKAINTVTQFIHLLDVLKNNRIFFPSYQELNDPLESNTTEINLQGYAGISIEKNADIEDRYVIQEKQKYHILSMSTTCRSPLMWAHYADNYKGVCLCFSSENTFRNMVEVEYSTKRNEYNMVSPDMIKNLVNKSFIRKQSEWSYEHELRLIERSEESEQKFINFSHDELKGIIFGHNMSDEIRHALIDMIPDDIKLLKTYIGHRTCEIHLLYEVENVFLDGEIPKYKDDLEKYLF